MSSPEQMPVVLTIAGSDCSAGAGIQADIKAFSALGVYGLTAVTSVVAEAPGKVTQVQPQPAPIVGTQVKLLLESFPVAAIKTGLLATPEIVYELIPLLEDCAVPIVIDPVAIASTGDRLVQGGFEEAQRRLIESCATLITPNRSEAESFIGKQTETAEEAASLLADQLDCAVLVTGGHFEGKECVDILVQAGKTKSIHGVRLPEGDVHGTGCTYSAAITARLAQGFELEEAVRLARRYLHQTLAECFLWPNPANESSPMKALAHFPKSMDD